MRWCDEEGEDFPDREFEVDSGGVWMHHPADGRPPHPANEPPGPSRAPETPFDVPPDDVW